MAIWYVKKLDNKIGLFKKVFKPIKITDADNKKIVELPDERYVNRLKKAIYEKNKQHFVIASELNEEGFNEISSILNGRWVFRFLIPEILEYIEKTANIELQKQEIVIMTDDNSENTYRLLIDIAQKVKMLKIVTTDIDKFRRLEEYLMENMGIVIHTTNNKKRALIKSSIIINIDFNEDILNQYSIPKDSIVININGKTSIKSRRFEGINCNYYNVTLPNDYIGWLKKYNLYGKFDEAKILESMVYYNKTYDSLREKLKDININYLIGNNGRIDTEEFYRINFHKLLDK